MVPLLKVRGFILMPSGKQAIRLCHDCTMMVVILMFNLNFIDGKKVKKKKPEKDKEEPGKEKEKEPKKKAKSAPKKKKGESHNVVLKL